MKTVWAAHCDKPDLHQALCDFVSLRIWGEVRPFFVSTSMGVCNADGVIVAGVIFSNYDAQAGVIEVSAAADTPRWLTRPILRELFSYPFNELHCQAVVMRTDPGNTRLHRILTAYGFTLYEIPRLRGRDKSEFLFVLTDDAWRHNGF